MGLKLTTLRSRVSCSSNGAGLEPLNTFLLAHSHTRCWGAVVVLSTPGQSWDPNSAKSLPMGTFPYPTIGKLWSAHLFHPGKENGLGRPIGLWAHFLRFLKKCLFLRERDTHTECKQGRGRERESETQNPKQVPGSEPSAQSLWRGLSPPTARSWPEPKSDV